MKTRLLLLFLLGVLSCRKPSGEDTADHGGSPGDTGTHDTGTHDTAAPPTDFELVAVDEKTWADDGYVIETWALSADAPDPYPSLFDDELPTFYLMRPAELEEGEAPDMLVWFHGGAIGDDSSGEFPYACMEDRILQTATHAVTEDFPPTALSRARRWVMVVPRNDWCDMWMGRGPDDPVDPEHHYGYYHVQRVLDFMVGGGAGFPVSRIFGWGTSMGGTGTAIAASRYEGAGGFDGVVLDSAPCSMFAYYELNHFGDDQEILEHVLGGPPYDEYGNPTEYWDLYADNSAETLVSSGKLTAPLFLLWNSLDTLDDPVHSELLIEAVDSTYPDTVRHGYHDFAHPAPGDTYHTQSIYPSPPWGYTGQAMIEFLDGQSIAWQEIEGNCASEDDCSVGEDMDSDDLLSLRVFSGAAGRVTTPDDGVGTAWCGTLPEEVSGALSPGTSLTITLVAVVRDTENLNPSTGLLTLYYQEGGKNLVESSFRVDDFSPEDSEDVDLALAQYAATRITVTPSSPEEGRVCIDVHGRASLYLDALIYGWPAEDTR